MPIFEVDLSDGRTLDIEAMDEKSAVAGAQYFLDQEKANGEADKPSGIMAGLQQGVTSALTGTAETLKLFTGADTKGLETAAQAIAPKDYKPAPVVPEGGHWYDPRTYNWQNVPQGLAEGAPGVAADIGVAKAASRAGRIPGLMAGIASYLLRTRGDAAKENAAIRTGNPNAVPETQDKPRSLATGAAEAIPQAVGLARFLPGLGRIPSVGAKGVAESVGRGVKTAGTELAVSGAQDAIGQAGATVGTQQALTIEPSRVANAAVLGGIGGGLLAAPRVARDATGAVRFREGGNDPTLQAARAAVANRVLARVNSEKDLNNPKEAYRATNEATGDVLKELKRAKDGLATPLSPDADNVLARVSRGERATSKDMGTLNSALDGVAGGDAMAKLANQASALAWLKSKGSYDSNKERFSGGLSEVIRRRLTSLPLVGAALGTGIGMRATGILPATMVDPTGIAQAAAVAGGGYTALRAAERTLGLTSPAGAFVEKFADPKVPTRTTTIRGLNEDRTGTTTSVPPTGPQRPPEGPGGPRSEPQEGPWGPRPTPQGPDDGPWGPRPAPAPRASVPPVNETTREASRPTTVDADIIKRTRDLMKAREWADRMRKQEETRAAEEQAQQTEADSGDAVSAEVPPELLKRTKALMKAREWTDRMRRQEEAREGADTPPRPGKITKKPGEQASADGSDYTPLTAEQLWGRNWSDEAFASRELQNAQATRKVGVPEAYMQSIINDRKERRSILSDIADNHGADADVLGRLLDELHHVRSAQSARQAIQHFSKQMSPEAAKAVASHMDDRFLKRIWERNH